MNKLLSGVSRGLLFFFGGVFFTLFIFTVIIVIVLYNENTLLRYELSSLKNRVEVTETKPEIKRIIPNTIIQEEPEKPSPAAVKKGIGWQNWQDIKNNLTADEVVRLLGNPTQVISLIDTTKYIYKDRSNEGFVNFNRQMRVISWGKN